MSASTNPTLLVCESNAACCFQCASSLQTQYYHMFCNGRGARLPVLSLSLYTYIYIIIAYHIMSYHIILYHIILYHISLLL